VFSARFFNNVYIFFHTHHRASISLTFSGFESEACGIVGYEWGVGTCPFATDVLPYSSQGLVLLDFDPEKGQRGFAQAHLMLYEGQT
jgi:hypothetical protein